MLDQALLLVALFLGLKVLGLVVFSFTSVLQKLQSLS